MKARRRNQFFASSSAPPLVPAPSSLVLALLLGAVSVAGFAPFYLYPVPILALAWLFRLWNAASGAFPAAALGFAYGLGFFGVGVSWVYVSLHVFGAMPAPLAGIATALFCAYLALFPALVGWFQRRVPVHPALRFSLLVPGLWVIGEWIRGWLFTGFPWIAMGYSQIPASPLAAYAAVLGIYGVSLAAVASAGVLATAAAALWRGEGPGRMRGAMVGLVLLAVVWLGGIAGRDIEWTRPAAPPIQVSLLQGNVPQDLKWREDRVKGTLDTYLELTRKATGRLVVLPETALPLFSHQVPADYWDLLTERVRGQGGDLLVGLPERTPQEGGRYYNSMASRGASPAQTYRKVHLVPFGEFIPPGFSWIVRVLRIPLSDFSRGDPGQRPLALAGERVAVNICYEDAFGEEIARQLPEANLLVNASNDAWFGDSFAIWQHLQMSQARALETGRYMLRATNTGVTAVIDPRGRVLARAEPHTLAVLNFPAQGFRGETPYIRWGNRGALLLALALCAAALLRRPAP